MSKRRSRIIGIGSVGAVGGAMLLSMSVPGSTQLAPMMPPTEIGLCTMQAGDVVGCQPSPFDVPRAHIPTRRINEAGMLDPTATEEQVRWGARVLEERLGLFRNFDHLHWVPLTPSVFNEETGEWDGGDLDGDGDGRALTIAGQCLFAGHANRGGGERPMKIYRISDHPDRDPPVLVGEIAVPQPGADDSIMAAQLITKADGTETIIVARDVSTDEGGLWVYEVDPANCEVIGESEGYEWGGDMHEFGIWADPNNPLRLLIVGAAWSGSDNPDPYREGYLNPDIRVQAITDENTGELLPQPISLAYFTLQDVGGPLRNERPDETGLFTEGRFPNYEGALNEYGEPLLGNTGNAIAYPTSQSNRPHQTTWSEDGKRIYVAHGTAGFYVLNSEFIANNTNADLGEGNDICNFDATNVWVDGVVGGEIDTSLLPELVNDCLHMTFIDDPGVQQVLASGDLVDYMILMENTRFDPFPSLQTFTGVHSAVVVPGRPSSDVNNTDGARGAYAIITSETFGCPISYMWMVNIANDAFPHVTGAFGPANIEVENCQFTPQFEYNGDPRRSTAWQNHNPTVFENLVFVSWYANGVRAIDISNPFNLREVGHAVPAPAGVARSYPVFSDGLMYWVDNDTGLHVARYTGPRHWEIPQEGVWEGNAATGHR